MRFLLKKISVLGVLICLISGMMHGKKPKILHIGFHQGCLIDFEHVARALNLDVTSWNIVASPLIDFDGESTDFHVYEITERKAEKIWKRHKDYFDQFDIFMTSDTAPLSRIFLQNQIEKPVVVWICNRFDYQDPVSRNRQFPDQKYYDLLNAAQERDNVKIIGYTPYEHIYASVKGVMTGFETIKPLGAVEGENRKVLEGAAVPLSVNKKEKLFLYTTRLSGDNARTIIRECKRRGIDLHFGSYSGPEDLKDFKGILYIPYQMSNLIFFEGVSNGCIFFVPSQTFRLELDAQRVSMLSNDIAHAINDFTHCRWMEWYLPEHKDLVIYFDSWDDLQYKIATADYQKIRSHMKRFSAQHRYQVLKQWDAVFDSLQ